MFEIKQYPLNNTVYLFTLCIFTEHDCFLQFTRDHQIKPYLYSDICDNN